MSSNQPSDVERKWTQWEFFNALVTARSDHIWRLGSIFLPTSFLLFGWAIIYNNIMTGNGAISAVLLYIASISIYSYWGIFLWRTNVLNDLCIEKMRELEKRSHLWVHNYLHGEKENYWITKRTGILHIIPLLVLLIGWTLYGMLVSGNSSDLSLELLISLPSLIFIDFIIGGVLAHRLVFLENENKKIDKQTLGFWILIIVVSVSLTVLFFLERILGITCVVLNLIKCSVVIITMISGVIYAVLNLIEANSLKKERKIENQILSHFKHLSLMKWAYG